MQDIFFLKGALLGFLIAAPVGPIAILCIRRTIEYGRWSGFFSGMGAAIADTLYGAIAAFGLTFISDFLIENEFWLRIIGGAFLVYLGIKTFLAKPMETGNGVTHKTLTSDFFSTFFLTMTNPLTIVSYLAVFASIGLSKSQSNYIESARWLILGVFLGSAIWWIILSEGITLFRKRVTQKAMLWINRFAGLFIFAFGLAIWLTLLL